MISELKLDKLFAVPQGVTTDIKPVVEPAGIVALIKPSLITEKVALIPLKFTALAPVKPLPFIATV